MRPGPDAAAVAARPIRRKPIAGGAGRPPAERRQSGIIARALRRESWGGCWAAKSEPRSRD